MKSDFVKTPFYFVNYTAAGAECFDGGKRFYLQHFVAGVALDVA